ncbi:NAD(P)-binding protein [Eremomyces bilateralis CBS 781.70]|uniref:NAD(P)-binding protein n=1 Tax=Eremomyces bilateralis CBS 781.70 TaxID=1392243 RepID=A0A6G1FWZ0_9PEZI|nr:NAD(P)-binding protein [Eremomyces bilateralis CBS 781.70]KAF1810405.1 NAD(P)-binding protein [Eremomyces bilateralis CBS 781.70]
MVSEFIIKDEDLARIKDKVVLVTGGSSGIGLATVELLVSLGARVAMGDRNPLPASLDSAGVFYQQLDVTSWESLLSIFKNVHEKWGRVDHVFANAGLSLTSTFFDDEVDSDGNLTPPNFRTVNVNLLGVISTVRLAAHYIKKHGDGGSVVLTASGSSFQEFPVPDYTTAKHGVLGFQRSIIPHLKPFNIRVNSIAPSWTATGLVPEELRVALGDMMQGPEVVARSTANLMADSSRDGQLIYSWQGRHMEIERAEGGLLDHVRKLLGVEIGGTDGEKLEAALKGSIPGVPVAPHARIG